jgi:hypothetical protein
MRNEVIDDLLELNGIRYVIDEQLGLWVKFEVKKVVKSLNRPHGIKYSLTLHDRFNTRLMGFDNSHAIEVKAKDQLAELRYDHWHQINTDAGRPYYFTTSTKLLEDFWREVDKAVKKLVENKNEHC